MHKNYLNVDFSEQNESFRLIKHFGYNEIYHVSGFYSTINLVPLV